MVEKYLYSKIYHNIMMSSKNSTVSKKGLTTVPIDIRRKLQISEGDALSWEIEEDHILVKVVRDPADFLRGKFDNLSHEEAEEMTDRLLEEQINE